MHDLLGRGFVDLALHPESARTSNRLAGHIDGATQSGIAAVVAALDSHGADTLWLDGSNLGRIAQAVKRARPQVRILTFFHNVEARFFLGALRRARNLRAAGVLIGNYVAERMAIRHSTEVIVLSDRDGGGLERLYGRRADHILPMALRDQLGIRIPSTQDQLATQDQPATQDQLAAPDAPLLFVGGSFYANQAGIAWFANAVAPRIKIRTDVVGQGMDAMRDTLERAPDMRVIGAVDSLEPLYRDARLVIAPIFDGSGMKTKVAEALMFGKRVVGTPEAFSGYAHDVVAANWCCSDAAEFVAAIAEARALPLRSYDAATRLLYERDHSPSATAVRLARILDVKTP
ncbi:glycosyltransferase [Sphingomonas sp. CFBP 13603]|uniref:glycosyltransferase n=1 Tax=Sphingomonas sp. CFBP 13603 TaxID=2774040 RepID=UPI0018676CB8|nr:glycosyltransferase family 4 protein [Sphingomonas sp. CFBP 13603]MBE2992949.1 glycosyltransferase [Sphingomonas sp. CFBP 13603]